MSPGLIVVIEMYFSFAARLRIVKTWPIDSLGLRNNVLEVSGKLSLGSLACGSHAFIATLFVDFLMSGLPINEAQKSQSVGLLTRQQGSIAGLRPM